MLFSSQFEKTFLLAHVAVGEGAREHGVEVLGNQEFLPELGAERLDAAGGVQHVAVIGHLAAEITDLGRNDGTAVCSGLETRGDAVLLDELGRDLLEAFVEVVEAVHGPRLGPACGHGPGEECPVTCNLVDFALVFLATVREQLVVVLHEVAVGDMPQFFGEFGRMFQVDEHEDEVLFEWFLRLAEQRVPENSRAELLVDAADKGDEVREREEQEHPYLYCRIVEARDDAGEPVLVHDAFACLDPRKQDAEDDARGYGADEVGGTQEQRFPDGPAVHLVFQDEDVVDAVRESHEKGELEHLEQVHAVDLGMLRIHDEHVCAYGRKDPAKDVIADGPELSFCLSRYSHWSQWMKRGSAQTMEMRMMSL